MHLCMFLAERQSKEMTGPLQPSDAAKGCLQALDARIEALAKRLRASRAWSICVDPSANPEAVAALLRECYRGTCWYQPAAFAAAMHMFGRFPRSDGWVIQKFAEQKAEQAGRIQRAREGLAKLGGPSMQDDLGSASPAVCAAMGVWWRIAEVEEPLGYLGAAFLFERSASMVVELVPALEAKGLPSEGLQFLKDQGLERPRVVKTLAEVILRITTERPEVIPAILRCYDYLEYVFPVPIYEEALDRSAMMRVTALPLRSPRPV